MNWKTVGRAMKKIIPTLGLALTGSQGAVLGSLIANAIKVEDSPAAILEATKNPKAVEAIAKWSSENPVPVNYAAHVAQVERNRFIAKCVVGFASCAVVFIVGSSSMSTEQMAFFKDILGILKDVMLSGNGE
jgi:hypothetical protein